MLNPEKIIIKYKNESDRNIINDGNGNSRRHHVLRDRMGYFGRVFARLKVTYRRLSPYSSRITSPPHTTRMVSPLEIVLCVELRNDRVDTVSESKTHREYGPDETLATHNRGSS